MKNKKNSRIGCAVAVILVLLLTISTSLYFQNKKQRSLAVHDGLSWVVAVEKCKRKYEAYSAAGQIKAPNCRKRSEDHEYFYFSWSRPLAIIIKKSDGKITKSAGKCQVSKENGEIVSMTLGKTVIVNKREKKN